MNVCEINLARHLVKYATMNMITNMSIIFRGNKPFILSVNRKC